MSTFPVDEAQIVALFMESVAYGVYLVTLGMCVQALFWENGGSKKRLNWPLICVTASMFIFATFDVAFGLRHNLDAFIFYKGSGGADAEFEDISYWVNVMKTVDVQMMTLIGDGMLIYRCLVIFAYNWWIVSLPLLLWIGNAVCSSAIMYITATLRTDTLLNVNQLTPFLTSFLVITLVTNLLTTGLIVWRIWQVDRQTSQLTSLTRPRPGRSRLANVIRIVVESGLLYTSLVLITFGTELAGSNAIYGVSDVMVVVVGISFNLIIIRIDRGVAVGHTFSDTLPLTSVQVGLRFKNTQDSGVEVTITKDIDTDQIASGSSGSKDRLSFASGGSGGAKKRWEIV